jgi:hypothetical protein
MIGFNLCFRKVRPWRGEERREGGATLSCVPMTEIGMPSEGYFAV